MTPRTVAACAVGALAALTLAAPAQAAAAPCAAYRYTGGQDTLCDKYSGARDVDCGEVGFQVTVVVRGVDPWRLDRDGDGRGCDSGGTPTRPPVKPCPTTPATVTPATTRPTVTPSTTAPTTPPTTEPALGMRLVSATVPCPSKTTAPATTRPAPTPSKTSSPATGGGAEASPGLPVTGPAVPLAAGVGAVLIGGLALLAVRRRRARFEA